MSIAQKLLSLLLLYQCFVDGMDFKNITVVYTNENFQLPNLKVITCLDVRACVDTLAALKLSTVLSAQIDDCDDSNDITCIITQPIITNQDPSPHSFPFDFFIDFLRKCTLLRNPDETKNEAELTTSSHMSESLQHDLNRHRIPFVLGLLNLTHHLDAKIPSEVLKSNLDSRFMGCVHTFAEKPDLFRYIDSDLNNELARLFSKRKSHRRLFAELKPKHFKKKLVVMYDIDELHRQFQNDYQVRWYEEDRAFIITDSKNLSYIISLKKDQLPDNLEYKEFSEFEESFLNLTAIDIKVSSENDCSFERIFAQSGHYYFTDPKNRYLMCKTSAGYRESSPDRIFPIHMIGRCDEYVLKHATLEQILTLAFLHEKLALNNLNKAINHNLYNHHGHYSFTEKLVNTCEDIYRKYKNEYPENNGISWAAFPHLKEAYDSLEEDFKDCINNLCENKLPINDDKQTSCTLM